MLFKSSAGLNEYAADSTYALPDILSLACGVDQADSYQKQSHSIQLSVAS